MSKRLMEEVKEKYIPTTGEITEEMVDACMEEYWVRSEEMHIELEKALSPDQPKELNRCWICGIDDGDHDNWGFDYDYDTSVHITCLKEWGVENIQQYEQKRWEEYDTKKDETRRLPDDIGEPEKNRFKFEIRKYDGIHAFGAYVSGSAKEGKAIILIDGEMVFKEGELLADGEPYDPPDSERRAILIETLMHEFGHAIEDLLDRETDEDFIEKCVESYRSTSESDKECLPTSKQIEENCRDVLFYELPPDQRETLYIFTPEELKAYREALRREQRERSAQKANDLIAEMSAANGRLITPSLVRKEIEELE